VIKMSESLGSRVSKKVEVGVFKDPPGWGPEQGTHSVGTKHDQGKMDWYPVPLEIVELLVPVFVAGEKKYSVFNCLQPFKDADRRFYAAQMRHAKECQIDPLAVDEETGCFHSAQIAFSALLRLYHALKESGR
jgi:hypothetical protein